MLQSELHCRAYKLYKVEGTLAVTLYRSSHFLVLVESPFTWFSLQLGKQTYRGLKTSKYGSYFTTDAFSVGCFNLFLVFGNYHSSLIDTLNLSGKIYFCSTFRGHHDYIIKRLVK